MVATVKDHMDKIERQLIEAEATVEGGATGGSFRAFMPLIFVSGL